MSFAPLSSEIGTHALCRTSSKFYCAQFPKTLPGSRLPIPSAQFRVATLLAKASIKAPTRERANPRPWPVQIGGSQT